MKVEFSAFPKAFSGNVAVFVAADKQLLATAQAADKKAGGTLTRAMGAGRFTGAKGQTLTVLGNAGGADRLLMLGVGKGQELDARAAEGLGGVIAAEANAVGHRDGWPPPVLPARLRRHRLHGRAAICCVACLSGPLAHAFAAALPSG